MEQRTRPLEATLHAEGERPMPDGGWPAGIPPRFQPWAFVGDGTSARIWKAFDAQTKMPCALKVLSPQWWDHPAARRMFANEASVGQRVPAKYVVRTIHAHLEASQPFLVQEWLTGESLEARLAREGRLFIPSALWIARQAVQGMLELQQAGFAHGDIKPANIFLLANGQVKLIDLGFARSVDDVGAAGLRGALTGTADYLAPETISMERRNPVARDVYSLGVTLFRMLTGHLPFAADTIAHVVRLHRETRPPALRRQCPEASRALAGLVQRMLAKQPIRRPLNLNDLLHELVSLELEVLPSLAAA